jgi:hypothetical protein
MRARAVLIVVIAAVCCVSAALAQNSAVTEPYVDADAYQVFSALMSRQGSSGPANTLIIQQETVPHLQGPSDQFPEGPEACIFPDVALKFKDAIADYKRVNQKRWLLQRNFHTDDPYELVTSDTLNVLFGNGDWDGFYKRYPSSGGFITLSAVGFNRDKTRAILYGGNSCGSLCGSWSFELLEKVDGKWKMVPGVSCHTVS